MLQIGNHKQKYMSLSIDQHDIFSLHNIWFISACQDSLKVDLPEKVKITCISNIYSWSLNVEKKLIAQFSWKLRDERFEHN